MKKFIHLCLLGFLASLSLASGATKYVSTTDDSGPGSLRQAIIDLNAGEGGEILFSNVSGTISLLSALPLIRKNIAIEGAETLTVDGRTNVSIFSFAVGSTSRVAQLCISRGWATNSGGGGILNSGMLAVVNCLVVSNETYGVGGGGIFNAGQLSISNSAIVWNRANGRRPAPCSVAPGGSVVGGGLQLVGGSATIANSSVTNNTAEGGSGSSGCIGRGAGSGGPACGGGIYIDSATVTLLNSTVAANDTRAGSRGEGGQDNSGGDGATGYGGGIYSVAGRLMIDNCRIERCRVFGGHGGLGRGGYGGGMYIEYGTVLITNTSFSENQAVGGHGAGAYTPIRAAPGGESTGGAIGTIGGGQLAAQNCAFVSNSVAGGNGGDYTGGVKIGGNGGWVNGGALSVDCCLSVSLVGSTFSGNLALGGDGGDSDLTQPGGLGGNAEGGALWSNAGSLTISNCTIAANQTVGGLGGAGSSLGRGPSAGGGFRLVTFAWRTVLISTLVAQNIADTGPDGSGSITSLGFNLISNTNVTAGWLPADLQNVAAQIGPLRDNGGRTLTHALLANSPAIDAGTSSGFSVDQRGQPRVRDNPNISNAMGSDGTDIGAFEMDDSLRLNEIQRLGLDVFIQFTSVSDKSYSLQFAPDLFSSDWRTLIPPLDGTGGILKAVDSGGAIDASRFYRVLAQPR